MPGRIEIRDLFQEVADEIEEVPSAQYVEFAYESFWRSVHRALSNRRAVLIHNVGRFTVSRVRVVKRMWLTFQKWRCGKFGRDEVRKRITYYMPFYLSAIRVKPGKGRWYKIKSKYAKTKKEKRELTAYPFASVCKDPVQGVVER